MRHLKAGRRLSRNASHRLAMFRNMAMSLFRHERIVTTVAKAKEARPFIEKLITLAKEGTLHARRLVLARLGTPSKAAVRPPEGKDKVGDPRYVITKLFTEIAPRYADRQGGYLRVLKRHQRRLGDAGETAFLELVREDERRTRKQTPRPTPAPLFTPPTPTPTPTPAPAPQPTPTEPTAENPQTPPTS
jgi:large subunit ribosomal protein L17